MSLVIGVQMDDIAGIDITGDTTFALALEAQMRGYELFIYQVEDMSFDCSSLWARGHVTQLRDEIGSHFTRSEMQRRNLAECDVILMRQDPPFDMGYITATHLLETLPGSSFVVNNPAEVRNAPEKILVTSFPDLMPPTCRFERASPFCGTLLIAPTALPSIKIIRLSPCTTSGR